MAWSSFYGMDMKPGDILTASQWNDQIAKTALHNGAYETGADYATGPDSTAVVSTAELASAAAPVCIISGVLDNLSEAVALSAAQMEALAKVLYGRPDGVWIESRTETAPLPRRRAMTLTGDVPA